MLGSPPPPLAPTGMAKGMQEEEEGGDWGRWRSSNSRFSRSCKGKFGLRISLSSSIFGAYILFMENGIFFPSPLSLSLSLERTSVSDTQISNLVAWSGLVGLSLHFSLPFSLSV